MNTLCRPAMAAVLMLALGTSPAAAAIITLDALDSGFYDSAGAHTLTSPNYLTGTFMGTERRSFFVFDLAPVAGTITSATLRLFNPEVSQFLHGYSSPDPTETLNIHDVSTPAASITLGTGGVAAFDDLGTGTLYGTRVVSAADNGTVVEIALTVPAVSDLNATTGLFVLGGGLSTIQGPADQHVFGFSMTPFVPNQTRQLVLDVTPIPEPSLVLLLIAGGAAYATRRARRRADDAQGA